MRSLSRLLSAASAPARSALAAPPALAVPRLLPLAGLDPGVRRAVAAVLVTAAALLAFHVRTYAFLCDDAFISFRYARNFAHGHGLVFNPGFERVEGYSNFLWVVVLAGLDRLGLEPPRASLLLSWASTLLLWGLVVAFAARWAPRRGAAWAVVVPALFLAANRSFAVWASSGLETRAFELCVVAGTLTLADELDDALAGSPLRLRCAWWFALGALTRPDGVLFGACALGAAALLLARRRALDLRRYAGGVLPFALLVGSGASTTARGSRTRTTPRLAGAPGGTRASSTWRRSRSSTPCGCGRRSSCWAAWRSRARTGPTCRRCSPR